MEHRNQQKSRRDCELSLQCSWCCKGTGQQEMWKSLACWLSRWTAEGEVSYWFYPLTQFRGGAEKESYNKMITPIPCYHLPLTQREWRNEKTKETMTQNGEMMEKKCVVSGGWDLWHSKGWSTSTYQGLVPRFAQIWWPKSFGIGILFTFVLEHKNRGEHPSTWGIAWSNYFVILYHLGTWEEWWCQAAFCWCLA
jgi:hypothetical protein